MAELPKMYHNKIQKPDGIQKVYSSINRLDVDEGLDRCSYVSIDKKIDDIFTDSSFVYKADVVIVTDDGKVRKRIVARNHNNLVTIDNEYIPISIIRDIYK